MPHAVILANGTPPEPATLRRALQGASLFLCADGGANAARDLGVRPAAIVGDFDSVTPETIAHFQGVPQIRDEDLERTDAEKSIDYALAQGPFDTITLLGASAGRLDHVLGHIGLLRKYAERVRLVMEDESGRAYVARGDSKIEAPRGSVISFFAVGAPVEGLTTENLRYPLTNKTLELGVQDSISNVVDASPAWIRFRRGHLLVIETQPPKTP
jgi:thiamine pyrophosphokinase